MFAFKGSFISYKISCDCTYKKDSNINKINIFPKDASVSVKKDNNEYTTNNITKMKGTADTRITGIVLFSSKNGKEKHGKKE